MLAFWALGHSTAIAIAVDILVAAQDNLLEQVLLPPLEWILVLRGYLLVIWAQVVLVEI